MNETIKLLGNHRCVRDFDSTQDVSQDQVEAIVKSAMAAPNWANGQHVSVIEVRDPEKKAMFSKACGNQKWIEDAPVFLLFCMDFHRVKLAAEKTGHDFRIVEDLEAIMIGSTDVGIALGNAITAAESMGLGIVPIGGVRRNPQVFVEVLNLPSYVFPISGLVVGVPRTIPEQKPRLPLKATYHKEQYCVEIQRESIEEYDATISAYMSNRTGGKDTRNWSSTIAQFYDTGIEQYVQNSSPTVKKQGFRYK